MHPYQNREVWFGFQLNAEPWAIGPVSLAPGKSAPRPFVGRNESLDAFQEAIREDLKFDHPPIEHDVRLDLYFWLQIVQYDSATGRKVTKNRPDLTNLQKATEDALQPKVLKNDRCVRSIHSHLVDIGPDVKPKIAISIAPWRGAPTLLIPQDITAKLNADVILSDNSLSGPVIF